MSNVLAGVEPQEIWKHFEALAAIPRRSENEAAVRAHIVAFANSLGLENHVDAAGNLVVRKPAHAGRESAPVTALQGHLDMVCEKNESTKFDFDTEGIRLVRKGEWLYADGTTLGSDNGIGVSAALAVMESKCIKHGPMEFIFTIEEETSLAGATNFKGGVLKAKYLLNLDNEEKGTLCIGCAGGLNTTARRKVAWQPASTGNALKINVSGLLGGHSGVDIHLGHGNAVRILGQTLQLLMETLSIELADLKGGSAHNAIPREAWAVIVAPAADEAKLKATVANFLADVRADLGSFDPGLEIKVEKTESPKQVMSKADAKQVADLLSSLHHGVLAMSHDIAGLVQDSTNVATVGVKDGVVEVVTSQRSAIEGSKHIARRLVATSCKLAGFETEHTASYPGWKPQPESEIVREAKQVFEEMYKREPKLIAMHAGLETGVLGVNYPEMQMISFGPQIEHPHSPTERVEIASVAEFWRYLKALLERL